MQAVQGGQGGALHMGGGGQGGLHLHQPVLVRLPAGIYGPLLNGLHCNGPVNHYIFKVYITGDSFMVAGGLQSTTV